MAELIKLIVDNGISVVCVAYLIIFSFTTMKDISKSLSEITTTLEVMKEEIKDLKKNKKSSKKKEDEE